MSGTIFWMLGIGASVAMLVVTAAQKLYYVHLVIAGSVAVMVALTAFVESRASMQDGKSNVGLQASANLRHIGLIWTWAALTTFVTYGFEILQWREWWQFFIAALAFAGLSLFLSATLQKDAEARTEDDTMFKISRGYALALLVVMPIVMIGLLQQGKMWRFLTVAGQRPGSEDWAASNIFFFGAMAMTAVAWNAVTVLRQAKR